MKVIERVEDYDGGASVVALGMFDGVHIGHQRLIREAVNKATRMRWSSIVSTFDRHPLSVVSPERAPKLLLTRTENLAKMEKLGAEWALVQRFDKAFAEIDPKDYVETLVISLNVRCIVVGENYTFGRKGRGNASLLKSLSKPMDFEAVIIPPVMDGDRMASSTYIRELLEVGETEHAEKLLRIESGE